MTVFFPGSAKLIRRLDVVRGGPRKYAAQRLLEAVNGFPAHGTEYLPRQLVARASTAFPPPVGAS